MTSKEKTLDQVVQDLQGLGPGDLQVVADAVDALQQAGIDQHRFLIDFWGISAAQEGPGRWIARMPIKPQVLNMLRIVHGGATYTLADTVMGYAVWQQYQGQKACVTVEIKMTYIAPGRGRELVAEVEVLRAGATLAYTDCRVRDDTGRLVATASGTYYAWDPSQSLPD